jgi:hypothetical protein
MDFLGHEDNYLTATPNPSLQQYDNYQIHDLYCSERLTEPIVNQPTMIGKYWIAVERVSPYGAIPFDFEAIAILYP